MYHNRDVNELFSLVLSSVHGEVTNFIFCREEQLKQLQQYRTARNEIVSLN